MSQRRVAITGLGIISPYGGDLPDFFARLLAGESAVHFLHTDDIPRPLAIPFVSCHGFNPDEALGRPLARFDRKTLYTAGGQGYDDYPAL